MSKIRVTYVTSSAFKQEENAIFREHASLADGTPVSDLFEFEIRQLSINEMLEVDLRVMVQAEVTQAYSQIRIPCIVEHAGLIFEDYESQSYPGGLTKPMWNTLRERFLEETGSAGRRVIARAVVAYCDGMQVNTFVGETKGVLADVPRGGREFYWDTVFIPDDAQTEIPGKTYAEIVADPSFGLKYKVLKLSQSTRAMQRFLDFLRKEGVSEFWP